VKTVLAFDLVSLVPNRGRSLYVTVCDAVRHAQSFDMLVSNAVIEHVGPSRSSSDLSQSMLV
jgi:hypothetical protein